MRGLFSRWIEPVLSLLGRNERTIRARWFGVNSTSLRNGIAKSIVGLDFYREKLLGNHSIVVSVKPPQANFNYLCSWDLIFTIPLDFYLFIFFLISDSWSAYLTLSSLPKPKLTFVKFMVLLENQTKKKLRTYILINFH